MLPTALVETRSDTTRALVRTSKSATKALSAIRRPPPVPTGALHLCTDCHHIVSLLPHGSVFRVQPQSTAPLPYHFPSCRMSSRTDGATKADPADRYRKGKTTAKVINKTMA